MRHGNHALNQSRGLLAAGCILGRRDWQRLAADRIATLLAESVDAQGVTNEQSIYYQLYNMEAYRAAATGFAEDVGMAVPRAFRRLEKMTRLLTHATLPDGSYASLGDTSHAPARAVRGTTAEYAATEGRKGPMPPARFVTFDAGFAFGRTGWGPRVCSRMRSCGRRSSGRGVHSMVTWITVPSRFTAMGGGATTLTIRASSR